MVMASSAVTRNPIAQWKLGNLAKDVNWKNDAGYRPPRVGVVTEEVPAEDTDFEPGELLAAKPVGGFFRGANWSNAALAKPAK
jgi:hypothetical protein